MEEPPVVTDINMVPLLVNLPVVNMCFTTLSKEKLHSKILDIVNNQSHSKCCSDVTLCKKVDTFTE